MVKVFSRFAPFFSTNSHYYLTNHYPFINFTLVTEITSQNPSQSKVKNIKCQQINITHEFPKNNLTPKNIF